MTCEAGRGTLSLKLQSSERDRDVARRREEYTRLRSSCGVFLSNTQSHSSLVFCPLVCYSIINGKTQLFHCKKTLR